MSWYRLYLRNAAGKVRKVEEVQASDDGAALQVAAGLGHPFGVEVWRRSGLVGFVPGRIPPAGKGPFPSA